MIIFHFHQLGPLGRVGLVVTESVCLFVCLFVPFPCDFFRGLSLVLRSHGVGRVKNVSQRVFKNPLAFFAAILCILMGYLANKGFERIFSGWKMTSKRGPPIKNPAYGRHWISSPMPIVSPLPWREKNFKMGVIFFFLWWGQKKLCANYIIIFFMVQKVFLEGVPDFHQLGPLGRVGLVVTESVCLFVCLFVPFPCDFFLGLSLVLRPHDQIPASHWSTLLHYHITASSQPGNSRLQTRFWLVSPAWPARSCAVLSQVFVERRRYRHSSLRLAAPLPRLGLAEALEGLAMLCWVYNDYVLFNIMSRRLKQIMLTHMDTVTSKDGWVYNNMNYFRYSIYIARMIPADSR